MFGLFKKKTELELLQVQYETLMKESFKFSTINRSKSDELRAEAEKIGDKIAELKK